MAALVLQIYRPARQSLELLLSALHWENCALLVALSGQTPIGFALLEQL